MRLLRCSVDEWLDQYGELRLRKKDPEPPYEICELAVIDLDKPRQSVARLVAMAGNTDNIVSDRRIAYQADFSVPDRLKRLLPTFNPDEKRPIFF